MFAPGASRTMNRNFKSSAAAVLLAVLTGGCGKDSTGPQTALDQAASIEIFSELLTQVFLVGFGAGAFGAPGGSMALPPAVLSGPRPVESVVESVPCDGGGTVTLTGTYSSGLSDQGTGSIGFDLRSTPNDCGVQTSRGLFRVNGNPNLRITYNLNVVGWQPAGLFTMTWSGGYTWSGPGGSGGCDVAISYAYDWSNPSAATMTGHMCGYQF